MAVSLSLDEKFKYVKISNRLHRCKSENVAWWIRTKDYFGNKKDPLGKEILNSCNLPFCPHCRARVAYKKGLDAFRTIEDYDYIYHWTFSPDMDLWDKVNYKDVRKAIFEVLKQYFKDDYGVIFGVHYVGDKKDNYKFRLHFHLLIFSKKVYPLNSLNYVNDCQDTSSIIVESLKKSLGIIGYVHVHISDVKKQKGKNFNLFESVKYLVKYLGFGKKDFSDDLLDEYCQFYAKYRMNLINYSGDFRKGRKLILRREKPKAAAKFIRGFKMVSKSVYWLKEKDIVPIDIDYYYDEYLLNLRTKLTEYLEDRKGVG